jgi:CRP/FNR family transcriptional regulator
LDCITFDVAVATPDRPAARTPAAASLCMACEVRARCLGDTAAQAGTVQLRGILAGRQALRGREILYRPGEPFDTVYTVRSGALISTVQGEGGPAVIGFHFPGEVVGVDGMATGRQQVTVTALEETQLCALRFAPRTADTPGARAFLARLWDMMSCELVRERTHQGLLGTIAPQRRLAAFLASVRSRMRGGRGRLRLPLGLTGGEIASYLRLPVEPVEATLHADRALP